MKSNLTFFRYFAYSLEIILLCVLQSTPNLFPELFGSKPLLLVPLALAIASKEDKIPSLIFGAVCGLMTDLASGGAVGFFAILLTLVCYAESHIFSTYFASNLATTMIVSVIAIPVLICLYFLVFKVFAGIPEVSVLFVNHYISRIVYTQVTVIPIYFVNAFLYKSLRCDTSHNSRR